ncbi:hypothetical protein PENSPDRAFT_678670 [Peniophora sp. CONT]|nr:hypothetical protein PENSPDRAFT_678670 [Peniophora sp. CONT]
MSRGPLTDAIANDHQEIKDYYDKYKQATDADTKARWSNQLRWELARHSVGEEIVVYPLLEQYLGATGKKLADEDRAEHLDVKKLLSHLESLAAGTDEHNTTLDSIMENLRPHMESEETHDLPQLEAALPEGKSASIAKEFQRTKMFVPTYAHPSAPNAPPLETLAGFLTLPMDKLRDAFKKFPTEEMKKSI